MRLLIGLGGNLGEVRAAFSHAMAGLALHCGVAARSSLYRTAPQGPAQDDFLNAAVLVETAQHPLRVLELCQQLEVAAGRERSQEVRWGPRPLDLDLLLAPELVIETPALVLPHPRLAERRFALLPAAELVPDWLHPRLHRTLAELASHPALAEQRCECLGPW